MSCCSSSLPLASENWFAGAANAFWSADSQSIGFFVANKPTRTVLRTDFMFDCRIEMKAIAFKPR